MNGRAAAVYGLVFLLVAAGAFAVVTVAEPPEPSMENPDVVAAEGDNVSIGDREYQVTGFGTQRGQPTASLTWTDENARSQETWDHAASPDGTTIEYEGGEYWVRIPQTADPSAFTLLESPGEDSNVSVSTDADDNWIVNDGEEYVPLENYTGFERVEIQNGSTMTRGSGNDTQQVRVDSVTNESVTVSWNDPADTERIARQTSISDINGQSLTVDVRDDGTVAIAFDQAEIDDYRQQHDDRDAFQTRMDGLRLASVISLVSFVLLIALAFLPRKE